MKINAGPIRITIERHRLMIERTADLNSEADLMEAIAAWALEGRNNSSYGSVKRHDRETKRQVLDMVNEVYAEIAAPGTLMREVAEATAEAQPSDALKA